MYQRGKRGMARTIVLGVVAAIEEGKTITRREIATRSGYSLGKVKDIVRDLPKDDPLLKRIADVYLRPARLAPDGFQLPSADEIVSDAIRNRTDLDVLWF